MNPEIITKIIIGALEEIKSPRFFNTEREFQGKFTSALDRELERRNIFPEKSELVPINKSCKYGGIKPQLILS